MAQFTLVLVFNIIESQRTPADTRRRALKAARVMVRRLLSARHVNEVGNAWLCEHDCTPEWVLEDWNGEVHHRPSLWNMGIGSLQLVANGDPTDAMGPPDAS